MMAALMVAVVILGIFLLAARPLWQTVLQRELEEEMLFRARSIAAGIERYVREKNNLFPQNLQVLAEEKMIRKLYQDPLTGHGRWYLVLEQRGAGGKTYLVVDQDSAPRHLANAVLVGVCSTSPESSFRSYRGRTVYREWAVVAGADENEPLPELRYLVRE